MTRNNIKGLKNTHSYNYYKTLCSECKSNDEILISK